MKAKFIVLAAAISLLIAPAAWASGIAAGIGPGSDTQHSGNILGIDIVHTFYIDPNGPPWTKTIDIEIPPDGLQQGTIIPLHEQLIIIPPPAGTPLLPLWDWHEIIHTPGWEWALPNAQTPPPSLVVHNRIDPSRNLPIEVIGEIGADLDLTNQHVDSFFPQNAVWFDPIEPHPFPLPDDALDIWIWKHLVYRGQFIPADPTGIPTFTRVQLWEHPTTIPEPTSMVLAACALLGLLAHGHRRRKA